MKKKGFTLIELLAVIVILAIIALIATPIVMNVIESSRKGAAERSYENYLRAVETAIAEERINGPVADGTYTIGTDGKLSYNGKSLDVEVSGTKPLEGSTVEIENGLIKKGDTTTLKIGDYTVKYDTAQNKVVATKTAGGSTVAKICTYVAEEGTTAGEIGAKYNCDPGDGVSRTFYLLEIGGEFPKALEDTVYTDDEEGFNNLGTADAGEVSLIMSENIDDEYFDWGTPTAEQVTVLSKLKEKTTGWTVEVYLPLSRQAGYGKSFLDENLDDPYGEESLLGLPYGFWTSVYASVEGSGVCYRKTFGMASPSCSENIGIRPVITIPVGELGE